MVVNAGVNDHDADNFPAVNPSIRFSRYRRLRFEHKAERMLIVHRKAIFSVA